MIEFLSIFTSVILPVFGIVFLGYLLGGRLNLQSQSLTRSAYYVFVPAFIFNVISKSSVSFESAARMFAFITLTHLLAALSGGIIGRLLGRSREMIAAFIMIAVFGNVGNYGLAVIRFRLGEEAVLPSTIYFVAITVISFTICVSAAGWARGGTRGALKGLVRTPALWAVVPALAVSGSGITVPLMVSRMLGLLGDAMIPVMLFALGLQLLEQSDVKLSPDLFIASTLRLLTAPALAAVIGIFSGLSPVEYASGILQAGMPVAVLVSIISGEYNIVPGFVTSVVLFTTLGSLLSLSLIMILV
jgi:malate permease and related proteins